QGDMNGEDYTIFIDGIPYNPESLLHFVYNPDPVCLYKGQGLNVPLGEVCENLAQAGATKKAFMSSKWMPPIIVKVDALTEEFASSEG
ncbi:phage portal protein, partial [Xanthomonas citri pv. citri]|nr:phage portal protein [Xanthomonas citri pv. citri]